MSTNRFRKPKTFFTQVSNHAIDDDRLSPQAYYIYCKIQRYITIENFVLNKEFLFSKCNMSENTFDKYWKELLHAGYLKIYQIPNLENKGHWITEYELLEVADLVEPYYSQFNSNGEVCQSYACKDIPSKVKVKEYKKPNKTVRQKVAEIKSNTVPPKNHPPVQPGDGKISPLNNTLLNKTLSNKTLSSSSSEDEDENLIEVINLYKECINQKISSKLKQSLKELINAYGKDHVITSIKVTMDKATSPNLAYLKRVCSSDKSDTIVRPMTSVKPVSKNPHFTSVQSHNWDIAELERREMEYIEKMYGDNKAPAL